MSDVSPDQIWIANNEWEMRVLREQILLPPEPGQTFGTNTLGPATAVLINTRTGERLHIDEDILPLTHDEFAERLPDIVAEARRRTP